MVILYCERCGVRVAPEELDNNQALRLDTDKALCSTCTAQERSAQRPPTPASGIHTLANKGQLRHTRANQVLARASESGERRASGGAAHTSGERRSSGLHVPLDRASAPANGNASGSGVRAAHSSARRTAVSAEPPPPAVAASRPPLLAAGVGAGAVALVALGVFLFSSSTPEPSPKPAPVAVVEPPKNQVAPVVPQTPVSVQKPAFDAVAATKHLPEPTSAVERDALNMLRETLAFQAANPAATDAIVEKLDVVYNAYRLTPAGQEAQKLSARVSPNTPQLAPEESWARAVELIPVIDVKKDGVRGKWTRADSALLSPDTEPMARLQLPVEPPAEYDLRVKFIRQGGFEDVNVIVPWGSTALMWSMGCDANKKMGFEQIGGKDAQRSPESLSKDPALDNDRPYSVVLQVRKKWVRAWVNGELVREYRGAQSNVSVRKDWALKNTRTPGVGTHQSKTLFQAIQLRTVSGDPRRLR